MRKAKEIWGEAAIYSNTESKNELGGPVHQMLLKKREAKMKRRSKQAAGGRR